MYMYVCLCFCIIMLHSLAYPWRPENGVRFPETGVLVVLSDVLEGLRTECDSLQEQQLLLSAKPPLQPLVLCFRSKQTARTIINRNLKSAF